MANLRNQSPSQKGKQKERKAAETEDRAAQKTVASQGVEREIDRARGRIVKPLRVETEKC